MFCFLFFFFVVFARLVSFRFIQIAQLIWNRISLPFPPIPLLLIDANVAAVVAAAVSRAHLIILKGVRCAREIKNNKYKFERALSGERARLSTVRSYELRDCVHRSHTFSQWLSAIVFAQKSVERRRRRRRKNWNKWISHAACLMHITFDSTVNCLSAVAHAPATHTHFSLRSILNYFTAISCLSVGRSVRVRSGGVRVRAHTKRTHSTAIGILFWILCGERRERSWWGVSRNDGWNDLSRLFCFWVLFSTMDIHMNCLAATDADKNTF